MRSSPHTFAPSNDFAERYAARLAGKTAFAIDSFITDRMETQDPLAAWIFSHKIFRNRFIARILGLRLEERRVERGREITVFCRGHKIGVLLIVTRIV